MRGSLAVDPSDVNVSLGAGSRTARSGGAVVRPCARVGADPRAAGWGEELPDTAVGTLHSYVSRLMSEAGCAGLDRSPHEGCTAMRTVTYSMGASADGYIVGPDGRFDWSAPDEEVFRAHIEELRHVGVHLMGRRLYETMLYWETAEQEHSLDDVEREWAALWNPLPKVVFSTSLSSVQGNARLATGDLAQEVERLRAEPGEGDIAIGGAALAAAAAALDLIDEYRVWVHPVLVGGGIPFFPQQERQVRLQLLESSTFQSRLVRLRYGVTR